MPGDPQPLQNGWMTDRLAGYTPAMPEMAHLLLVMPH